MVKTFTQHKFRIWLTTLLTLLLCTTHSHAAVSARTDRTQISPNESFTLTFESDSAFSGDPDFTPLTTDFEIVNTSRSSNTRIINGDFNQSTTWTVILFPKRAGALGIPAIQFDKEQSNPIELSVTQSAAPQNHNANDPVFMEVHATPRKTWVQTQILYTVRLLYSAEINIANNASLSEPEINQADALVKKLGEDKRYETRRNNQRYIAYERQYAIFPQKSGEIHINPIQFSGQMIQHSNSLFDDPFFTRGRAQLIRRISDPITLNIQPIPADYTGRIWLPANDLRLTETWAQEPPTFKVGEPITRSISITATGLTSAQIPELAIVEQSDFRQYPDQPYLEDHISEQGITGMRQEKIAMIPNHSGPVTLPAIEIQWWNTHTNRIETARLPERTVMIAANANAPESPSMNTQPVNPATQPAPTPHTALPLPTNTSAGFWPWLSALLACGWLLTGLLWFRQQRHTPQTKKPPASNNIRKQRQHSVHALKQACQNNQPDAAKTALFDWAKHHWPDNIALPNLNSLAAHCEAPLDEAIRNLNTWLYNPNRLDTEWRGAFLWEAFKSQKNKKVAPAENPLHKLQPLHKIS